MAQKQIGFAINDHFEFHGAFLNRSCYNETAVVTLHTLNKHLSKLLPVVAELFTEHFSGRRVGYL
jgi:predicted Zn-dependent peptidase